MPARLTRPRPTDSQEDKWAYYSAIARALDTLGVRPGDPFIVDRAPELAKTAPTRRGDPDTSRAAAARIEDLTENQQAVLIVLTSLRDGGTDEELIAAYDRARPPVLSIPAQSESGIRTRRKELADAGFVIDTGLRRRMSTGSTAIVWRTLTTPVPVAPPVPEPPQAFGEERPLFDTPAPKMPGGMDAIRGG